LFAIPSLSRLRFQVSPLETSVERNSPPSPVEPGGIIFLTGRYAFFLMAVLSHTIVIWQDFFLWTLLAQENYLSSFLSCCSRYLLFPVALLLPGLFPCCVFRPGGHLSKLRPHSTAFAGFSFPLYRIPLLLLILLKAGYRAGGLMVSQLRPKGCLVLFLETLTFPPSGWFSQE